MNKPQMIKRFLYEVNIAVRSGQHGAQSILRRFGLESTVRRSLAIYNTVDEIDWLTNVLKNIQSNGVK